MVGSQDRGLKTGSGNQPSSQQAAAVHGASPSLTWNYTHERFVTACLCYLTLLLRLHNRPDLRHFWFVVDLVQIHGSGVFGFFGAA